MCIKRKESAPPADRLQAVRFCVFLYAGSIGLAFKGGIFFAVLPLLFPDPDRRAGGEFPKAPPEADPTISGGAESGSALR